MITGTNYGFIENIKTSGEVNGQVSTGGIVGLSTSLAEIKSCINNANISGDYQVGGITGYSGITGSAGLITRSGNNGIITATRGFAGGISSACATIIGCYNKGDVLGYSSPPFDPGYTSVGGIQGHLGPISYSYNTGKIQGEQRQVGGILGTSNRSNIQMINNCYNIGILSGLARVGSIIGQCNGTSFDSCWWTTPQVGSRKFRLIYKFIPSNRGYFKRNDYTAWRRLFRRR